MACGYQSPKWMGKCPNCGAWNQMEEIVEKAANPKHGVKSKEAAGKVQTLDSIKMNQHHVFLQNLKNLTVYLVEGLSMDH